MGYDLNRVIALVIIDYFIQNGCRRAQNIPLKRHYRQHQSENECTEFKKRTVVKIRTPNIYF
jgi:hypothetical protein